MFTGDKSGEFLFRALHETGFASQPDSTNRVDGLRLTDAYITASCRCAPPGNKPTADEVAACRPYLGEELVLLRRVQAVVALGRLAFDNYLQTTGQSRRLAFGHGVVHDTRPVLIASYHPSQQNTSTGRLTAGMLRQIFAMARATLQK
jgi:uracil-DNA glycosylase family 4